MVRGILLMVGVLLVAGCTDPTAVEKFAQSAPSAAGYHALLVNYANLGAEEANLHKLEPQPNPTQIANGFATTKTRCGELLPLDNLHAAMIGYMTALGALASTGTTSSASSGPATQTPASTQSAAPAAPPTPAGADYCAAPLPKPPTAASNAGAGSAAPAKPTAAQSATANSLSTSLVALAKADPKLNISTTDAGAAGALAQLVIDVATAAAREAAIANALKSGHDAFLAAIAVETSVVTYGLSNTAGNASDLSIYNDILSDRLSLVLSNSQDPKRQATAVRQSAALSVALANGTLLTPVQAANLSAAAQAYLSALVNLKKAYGDLTDASNGSKALTTDTWNQIEPLLSDVAAAYVAVNKL